MLIILVQVVRLLTVQVVFSMVRAQVVRLFTVQVVRFFTVQVFKVLVQVFKVLVRAQIRCTVQVFKAMAAFSCPSRTASGAGTGRDAAAPSNGARSAGPT